MENLTKKVHGWIQCQKLAKGGAGSLLEKEGLAVADEVREDNY
jgi:hypothetical protein